MTPPDFGLWGNLKAVVYATPVPDVEELERRIMEAARSIPRQTIQRCTAHVLTRAQKCIEVRGQHFEQVLKKRNKE